MIEISEVLLWSLLAIAYGAGYMAGGKRSAEGNDDDKEAGAAQ